MFEEVFFARYNKNRKKKKIERKRKYRNTLQGNHPGQFYLGFFLAVKVSIIKLQVRI